MSSQPPAGALRVANCSGFFGDRLSAAREMVEGGPIDVLTGDWLAELTMLILAKQQSRAGGVGYARTFLTEMEDVLGTCLERGIKVVSNAGGLDPIGCAAAVEDLGRRLGLRPVVAAVTGDDLRARLGELRAAGERLPHLDTGEPFDDLGMPAVSANAYLGHRGIAEALRAGADVVVTGRVADAALVTGPAAWHHGWSLDDWDCLAGATVAGHVIECGAQTTGGNYAFFREVPGLEHCGFPLAEVAADGSAVVTKHPGTGGAVTVETVTAQLLYEISGARYPSPDVVVRLDTVRLEQDGADRVAISGTVGEPAPERLKVSVNYLGGYRNAVTFVLPGLEVEAKAAAVEAALWANLGEGPESFDEVAVELSGCLDELGRAVGGPAHLRVAVLDRDPRRVGRRFSNAAGQLALSSYPGFHTTAPPGDASAFGVFWPATVGRSHVDEVVRLGEQVTVLPTREVPTAEVPTAEVPTAEVPTAEVPTDEVPTGGPARGGDVPAGTSADPVPPGVDPGVRPIGEGELEVPLGWLVGARSGDKGGDANVGVWARNDATWSWLRRELTPERVQALLPATAAHRVTRHELPNLRALNFVVHGLLGRGVAASTRADPQAKGLGEELRAALAAVPAELL